MNNIYIVIHCSVGVWT